jgi:hypothetical protein
VYAQAGRGPKLTGTTLGALQQHHFTSRKSCRQIATFVKLNAGLGGTMLFVSLSATRRRQHSAKTLDVRGRAIQSNLLPLQRLISNHIRVAKKTAQLGSLCVQRSIMPPQSSGIRCPASGACLLGLPRALTALKDPSYECRRGPRCLSYSQDPRSPYFYRISRSALPDQHRPTPSGVPALASQNSLALRRRFGDIGLIQKELGLASCVNYEAVSGASVPPIRKNTYSILRLGLE